MKSKSGLFAITRHFNILLFESNRNGATMESCFIASQDLGLLHLELLALIGSPGFR